MVGSAEIANGIEGRAVATSILKAIELLHEKTKLNISTPLLPPCPNASTSVLLANARLLRLQLPYIQIIDWREATDDVIKADIINTDDGGVHLSSLGGRLLAESINEKMKLSDYKPVEHPQSDNQPNPPIVQLHHFV